MSIDWARHSSNFARFSKELLCDDKLSDVILVSEDFTQFQAHKVILCASSDLFRTLFVSNPHPSPMLFLKGIRQEELQSILEFVYLGETTVLEEDMQRLLTAARDLEITELQHQVGGESGSLAAQKGKKRKLSSASVEDSIQGEGSYQQPRDVRELRIKSIEEINKCAEPNIFHSLFNSPSPDPSNNLTEESPSTETMDEAPGQEPSPIKCEEVGCQFVCQSLNLYRKHLKTEHNIKFKCKFCGFISPNKNQHHQHIENQHKAECFDCLECRYRGRNVQELTKHVINAHRMCEICEYRAPTRVSFEKHLKDSHNIDGDECLFCDYKSSRKHNLIQHIKAKHKDIENIEGDACGICDFKSSSKHAMTQHIKSKHK